MKTKIDCAQILSLLKNGYLDNELDGATQEQVNQHLQECSACRRIRENLEAISLLLRNAPRANPPENLWARIQADIRAERAPGINLSENIFAARRRHFFTRRNALTFAAAAALVLMAVGVHLTISRTNNGEPAPSLSSLIGNDEMREPSMNFESNIEKYFL
ncbi:MAG: zf-HC2 domain-containing protein [Kiritimatiellia bacterium]|nr:zf-HC2 domain-containing protein [Kiritimatiellia bacterium]